MKKECIILLCCLFSGIMFAQTSSLNRPNDPVVLTGAQLSSFSALYPNQLVGFKFMSGFWIQIPIQIDERALTDIVVPYGPFGNSLNLNPSPSNLHILAYSDPNTYTGADPIPNFDPDDELVFMAKDAGGPSDGSNPQGVVAGTCSEVTIIDPLGGTGFVYIFQNGGSLQQDAGMNYVNYSTNLPTTAGFPAHGNGYNVENTNITTSKFSWHFSAEWVCDEYKLFTGNGLDILDRYKNFFANGNCQRHEDAFSAAQNAFVTAKSGPIRAIRSVLGAVSGPLTQRSHVFYEGRQDIFTDLRVHNIASIYDAFDYNNNANGMIYRNNLNQNGVTINGQPDVLTSGDLTWEQITGSPGTISILHRRTTTLASPTDATFTSYFDDNATNPASNCTGDGQAWGTSGIGIIFANGNICTDPRHPCGTNPSWYRTLQSRRIIYTDPANGLPTVAASYHNQLNNPLNISISTCQAPATTHNLTTSSNPTAGGNTTGAGTYASGSSVAVTATPNNGYAFTHWTENGNPVSTNSTYTFTLSADRNLVANFEVITSFESHSETLEFSIAPNPSSGRVVISSAKDGSIWVFNQLGQCLQTFPLAKTSKEIWLEESGVYIVWFIDGEGHKSTAKIVVSK